MTLARALSLNPAILLPTNRPVISIRSALSAICEILDNLCRNEKDDPSGDSRTDGRDLVKAAPNPERRRLIADMQTSRFGDAITWRRPVRKSSKENPQKRRRSDEQAFPTSCFSRRRNKKAFVDPLCHCGGLVLVVWVIGGTQSFVEVVHTDNRPFGATISCSVQPAFRRNAAVRAFGGPLARRPNPAAGDGPGREGEQVRERFDPLRSARAADGSIILDRLPENIPAHMRKGFSRPTRPRRLSSRVEEASLTTNRSLRRGESARIKGTDKIRAGAGTRTVPIPESLLDEMAGDPLVCSSTG